MKMNNIKSLKWEKLNIEASKLAQKNISNKDDSN